MSSTTQPTLRQAAPKPQGSYASQREHMVSVAREHYPDADKIEAFAAPETPYLIIKKDRKGFYLAWWEVER